MEPSSLPQCLPRVQIMQLVLFEVSGLLGMSSNLCLLVFTTTTNSSFAGQAAWMYVWSQLFEFDIHLSVIRESSQNFSQPCSQSVKARLAFSSSLTRVKAMLLCYVVHAANNAVFIANYHSPYTISHIDWNVFKILSSSRHKFPSKWSKLDAGSNLPFILQGLYPIYSLLQDSKLLEIPMHSNWALDLPDHPLALVDGRLFSTS